MDIKKLENIINTFYSRDTEVIIICSLDEIASIATEIMQNSDVNKKDVCKNIQNSISLKIGVQSVFYKGKQIHLVDHKNSSKFFEFMHLMNK